MQRRIFLILLLCYLTTVYTQQQDASTNEPLNKETVDATTPPSNSEPNNQSSEVNIANLNNSESSPSVPQIHSSSNILSASEPQINNMNNLASSVETPPPVKDLKTSESINSPPSSTSTINIPPITKSSQSLSIPTIAQSNSAPIQNENKEAIPQQKYKIEQKDLDNFVDSQQEKDIDLSKFDNVEQTIDNIDKINEIDDLSDFESKIANFEPTDMLTVLIPRRKIKNFYINVTKSPALIKVAFVSVNEGRKIDFNLFINKRTIKQIRNSEQEYFEFTADEVGLYVISLMNRSDRDQVSITIAIHSEENRNDFFNLDHLTDLIGKINTVNDKAKRLETLKKQYSMKYNYHINQAQTNNKNLLMFSILESAVMILVFFIQMKYIINLAKKL